MGDIILQDTNPKQIISLRRVSNIKINITTAVIQRDVNINW